MQDFCLLFLRCTLEGCENKQALPLTFGEGMQLLFNVFRNVCPRKFVSYENV